MSDANQANSGPESRSEASQPGRWRHVWFPAGLLTIAALTLAFLWLNPLGNFDSGMQRIYSTMVVAISAALLIVWFLLLSGSSYRARIVVAALLVIAAIATVGAVRGIEFTGDMRMIVDWRWQPSGQGRLAEYLATQPENEAPFEPPILAVAATDWPEYRGPHRDGVVADLRLTGDWQSAAPRVVWKRPCGGGYASFAVVGNQAITIEQRGPEEVIVSYDTETGGERWLYGYQALFSETLGGDGPRATPTFHEGRIYSLGATGRLVCLDAGSGGLIWQTDILADNEVANLTWGMSGSPLVYQQTVIVSPGTQKGDAASSALLGFSTETGKLVWRGGEGLGSYASPMLATLVGREQILNFDAVGLAGFAPEGGEPLWQFSWKSDFDINAAQPVVIDDQQVLITSNAGAALVRLTPTEQGITAEEVWANKRMKADFACPVLWQGHIYGLDKGILVCLDVTTGERLWKGGRYGHGQLLLVDGRLIVLTETGKLALVEATPTDFQEIAELDVLEGKTWNNPALAGTRLYVRNHLEMACLELAAQEAATSAEDVENAVTTDAGQETVVED